MAQEQYGHLKGPKRNQLTAGSAQEQVAPCRCRDHSPETTLEVGRCHYPGTRSAGPCCLGPHTPLRPPTKRLRSSIDQRYSSLVFQEIACPHGCMRVGQEDITHPRGSGHGIETGCDGGPIEGSLHEVIDQLLRRWAITVMHRFSLTGCR